MKSVTMKTPKRSSLVLLVAFTIILGTIFPIFTFAQSNECIGSSALTVYTNSCGGATTGTTLGATSSMAGCSGTADDDVWYNFIPDGGPITITVTSPGGAGRISDIVFEVFSGSCGSLTSVLCRNATTGTSNETATLNNLVNGATYYIRIYSAANGTGQGNFTVCITKPTPPTNDNCSGATSLTPAATCVNGTSQRTGSLINATNSGLIAGGCGGTADDDVWYSFVAAYNTHTITLSSIGSAIAVNGTGIGGSAVVEVFASSNNTCGGVFTSIACGQLSGTNLIAYANSLTVGNTYFIRVYSNNSVSLNANAGFNICVQNPFTGAPTVNFGKSFINITKGNTGGTVETGDVLEIRAAIVLRATSLLDSCAFYDNIPAGTNYIPGTLAILTNEGKVYKSFSDASGDDAGTFTSGAVAINMGYNTGDNVASAYRRGRLRNTNRPVIGGGCLMMASYRVTVTAATNTLLSLGGGSFTYALITAPSTIITHNFNANTVVVYSNNGLCSNSSGVNVLDNSLAGDFDGTFGSGNFMNRVASPNVPPGYTYTQLTGSAPGDFFYGITNNTSNNAAGYSTVNTWPKPQAPATNRIFGVFDVIGDHTGAGVLGNSAADTTNGGVGGYMLLVNAAYNLDTAFKYPISGLCPNTYYEISFWVRNICSRCGIDSVGRGASGVAVPAGYIPTDIGDSSGVYPNMSLSIDGVNHYTTGNIRYTGEWVKKGFVFRTGPSQTNIEFAITNNAPGGGGNDWALDDISLATCTPNLNLVPSGNAAVCYGNQVDLNCEVISFFSNYLHYQWQVSNDNGATWVDTLASGVGSPTYDGTNYTYAATFPSFLADSSQHNKQYRIRVATTAANLASGCSFFNSATIRVLVNDCSYVLATDLLTFNGQLRNKHGVLNWTASNEAAQTRYEVQRSFNGSQYKAIGVVNATNGQYTFTDPEELIQAAYYRIVIREEGKQKISKTILLTPGAIPFEIITAINPFTDKLQYEVSSPANTKATIRLSGEHGKLVYQSTTLLQTGINRLEIQALHQLASGTYILQVATSAGVKTKRIIKLKNPQ